MLLKRRSFLRLGLAASGTCLLRPSSALPHDQDLLEYVGPPDGIPDSLSNPSPPAKPFVAELFIPPVKQPVARLDPEANPSAHQRFAEFLPKKFYEIRETEIEWEYHPDPPYHKKSWAWGFDGVTPGPTFHARYGEPIFVRRYNNLPPMGKNNVTFALPSTTNYLQSGHTASESNGFPLDYIVSGEYWDHHYANYPPGGDSLEKPSTLWYHDHRKDSTAANVYAGLSGSYLLFDQFDSGDENDRNPGAWRLPSGKYDVPLLLHDVQFDQGGQVVFDPLSPLAALGDQVTVNRKIRPFLKVERRKYRFRMINGGPSRFYQLSLSSGKPFIVLTSDGNFLHAPLRAASLYLSVAQSVDVIIDFTQYKVGEQVVLVNRLEHTNGPGPIGRLLDPGDGILRFDVTEATGRDNSRIPSYFRPPPAMDLKEMKHRIWNFDSDGKLGTINGHSFDPERIDAEVGFGLGEIWILRNGSNRWMFPVHSEFTQFLILEINGKPFTHTHVQSGSKELSQPFGGKADSVELFMGGQIRDVITLFPGDEVKVFVRFRDFLGKYLMYCNDFVRHDHGMMIRFDIVPGRGVR